MESRLTKADFYRLANPVISNPDSHKAGESRISFPVCIEDEIERCGKPISFLALEELRVQGKALNELKKNRTPEQEGTVRALATESRNRRARLEKFIADRGKRYSPCEFENFDGDRVAIKKLEDYLANLHENIANGVNVILYGGCGSGKDHLLSALSKKAILDGAQVLWMNGDDVTARIRQTYGDNASETEAHVIDQLSSVQVLYISDPVPIGALRDHHVNTFWRLIDRRYNDMRPTWISVNVSDREGLNAALTVPIADRLVDGSVAHHLNANSHRKSK